MLPTITVAICTKDHPAELRRCLASCEAVRGDALEILVVDNGSAGTATREAAESFGVRYVREETPGLAAARNAAVAAAKGDVVAFTDDDCEVDRQFVAELRRAYDADDIGCVTGRAIPSSAANPVEQLVATYLGDGGEREITISMKDTGWRYHAASIGRGANMSLRKELLQRIGGFPRLFSSSADDYYIFVAVLRAGARIRYTPRAIVVQRHRNRIAGQARRSFQYGRNTMRAMTLLSAEQRSPALLARNAARTLGARAYFAAACFFRRPALHTFWAVAQFAGVVAGTIAAPLWWFQKRV